MKIPRALQQGMMGASQRSLAPSLTALGPNRYLKEKDFLTMVGVAFVLHLAVVVIISILPDDKVTDIPVRALSFKIGGQDRIAAFGAPTGVGATVSTPKAAAAPASSSTSTWRASPRQQAATPAPLLPPKRTTPKIVPVQPVKPLPFESSPRQMPVENASAAFQPPPPVVTQTQGLPSPDLLNQPAIAATPQRFVREVGNAPIGATANTGLGVASGANGGQGVESTMTPGTAQEVRERYEQQISAWIQQHKIYPTQARGAEATRSRGSVPNAG